LASAKLLISGDWQKATDCLLNLEVWNLIPNDEGAAVKAMLALKLKEEALRIYLINGGVNYDSIALSHLCELFSMDASNVRRIVSKMIFQQELYGAWDRCPEEVLVLYKVEPTVTHQLVQQLSEKINTLMENNERILDPLTSSYGYKDDWSSRDQRSSSAGQGNRDHQIRGRRNNVAWKSSSSYQMNAPNTRAYQSQQSGNRTKGRPHANTPWGGGSSSGASKQGGGYSGNTGSNKPKGKKNVSWPTSN
jgi:hypothetical protein